MKNIFLIVSILFSSIVFSQNWKLDFDEAKQLANEENKNIILVFSGSDWCAPCIKLDRNIWQSEAFKKESDENWIIVKADFPRKKANQLEDAQMNKNRKMAEKYNIEGSFPLVVVLDKSGKILGKMGFKNVSSEEYVKMIQEIEK
ncbi:thioredoxin family protein [Flavobacterium sp.]|uniref:thioredoxin family protein n=1 Tax=Flavobacterium sp. TaxID=239 RepID=UPI003D298B73